MKVLSILLLVVPIAFLSCDDMLQEETVSTLTTEEIYSSVDGLKSAVIGLYHLERSRFTVQPEGRYSYSIMCGTDLTVYRVSGDEGAAFYNSRMSPTNSVVGFNWSNYYEIIERANSIIYYAEEEVSLVESDRIQIVTEARVARAHAYLHLIRLFDNIVLNTDPTLGLEGLEFSPADQNDVYKQIDTDLQYTIDNLEHKLNPGRYTKAVAMHLKAKSAMLQEEWAEAAELAISLISEGPHTLLEDVNELFLPGDLDHSESLYVMHFNISEPGDDRKFHRMPILFNTRYNLVSGLVHENLQGGYSWGRIYPNEYLLSLYYPEDKRIDAFYNQIYFFNDENSIPAGFELGDTVIAENYLYEVQFKSLYPSLKKYWDLGKSADSKESYKDIIIYRLAETYLMAAEALLKENRAGEGLYYINAVRERSLGVGHELTGYSEDIILEERARELAMEGHRWYTLKRMGKLVERVRLYAGDDNNLDARENIQDYHVRRPIPQIEIDLMEGYPQNLGYEAIGK